MSSIRRQRLFSRVGQSGAILPIIVFSMITIIGFTAFTVDYGRYYVARNELKNAADAAALAGIGSIKNFYDQDWASVCSEAKAYAMKNEVLKEALKTGDLTIDVGLWDASTTLINRKQGFALHANCNASPILTISAAALTSKKLPAVRVNVTRVTGTGSGGIATVFSRVFGINSLDGTDTAIAAIARSDSGRAMPFGFSGCLKSALINPDGSPVTNKAITFRVFQTNSSDDPKDVACKSTGANAFQGFAQWVPFCTSSCNGAKSVSEILVDPDSAPIVELNDQTAIDEGVKESLFNLVDINTPVLVPVLKETYFPTGGNASKHVVTIENFVSMQPVAKGETKPILNNNDIGNNDINYIDFRITDPIKFLEGLPDTDGGSSAAAMTKSFLVL